MNMPPFLIGAALLFWGWQAELLWLGALAAAVLESSRFIRARWEFAQADLDRIWNLCVLLCFGAMMVAFVASDGASAVADLTTNNSIANRGAALNKGARSAILMLLWLPLTFLPIVVAQAFSQRERMDWSTFSWWLRRQRTLPSSHRSRGQEALPGRKGERGKGSERQAGRRQRLAFSFSPFPPFSPATPPSRQDAGAEQRGGLNVAWPYFTVCLLAASAANERTWRFAVGLVLLAGWGLWTRRPRGFPALGWVVCLAAAIVLGIAAQSGLRGLQELARRLDGALVARFASGRDFDSKQHQTMLGAIGRMKLSGRIVLRVEADGAPPPLLREASYKLFKSPFWASPKHNFDSVIPENDLTTWRLLRGTRARQSVTIAGYLPGGQGLLPAPLGVSVIEDLPAAQFQTNKLGVLSVAGGPGLARFRATYDEGASIDSPPDADDTDVPTPERPAVARVADQLNLRGLPAEEALKRVAKFFAEEFHYSIWLSEGLRSRSNDTALARFLLHTRAGHCEYFAAATVMLLREAGLPARYAVGYAVQEKKGSHWVVRERHAHSWCLAWVNGAWRDVDNTPGSWAGIEAARARWWERISDAWSRVWFEFSKWRWGKGEWKRYLIWLMVPLIGLTTWRLMTHKQWSRARQKSSRDARTPARPGLDSEFYLVEHRLIGQGLDRRQGETLSAWLARLTRERAMNSPELSPLLRLHYRLRFDPAGLNPNERATLKNEATAWFRQHEGSSTAH
jgi:hypothetical protein